MSTEISSESRQTKTTWRSGEGGGSRGKSEGLCWLSLACISALQKEFFGRSGVLALLLLLLLLPSPLPPRLLLLEEPLDSAPERPRLRECAPSPGAECKGVSSGAWAALARAALAAAEVIGRSMVALRRKRACLSLASCSLASLAVSGSAGGLATETTEEDGEGRREEGEGRRSGERAEGVAQERDSGWGGRKSERLLPAGNDVAGTTLCIER